MESERIRMKMKVVLLVVVAILTILSSIRPSIAQDEVENMGCWVNITNCLSSDGVLECCPTIQQEIDNERDCFCLMKETATQNATMAASFSTIFSFCGISGSFETLCPTDSDSSSTPLASPESPPSSISSEAPVEEPSPPSRTPTLTTETPIPTPETPLVEDGHNCWSRITSCTDSKSEDEMLQCCPLVKQEIADERECFCAAKYLVHLDSSDVEAFSQFLTLCKMPGSFNTLCPGANDNSISNGTTTTSSRSPSISGSTKTNKVAYSVGLISSSLLIILVISGLIE